MFNFEGVKTLLTILSGDCQGGTPVPIPNTEVKPLNVDDTWWETARESR